MAFSTQSQEFLDLTQRKRLNCLLGPDVNLFSFTPTVQKEGVELSLLLPLDPLLAIQDLVRAVLQTHCLTTSILLITKVSK